MTGEPVTRHSLSRGPGSPDVWGLHDPVTGSVQYVCADPETRRAAIIDAVLDFDPRSGAVSTGNLERILDVVEAQRLDVAWVLDTHPHADHLMASATLARRTGAPTATGAGIRAVASLWERLYNLPGAFAPERDFDRMLAPGDTLELGALTLRTMPSPGHTLASVSFLCGDAAFIHDTLMHPDAGTSRTDFPGGSAAALWDSIQAILSLPPDTRLLVGHDYGAPGRDGPAWEASVAQQRAHNVHVRDGTRREDWIAIREARDATLPLPERMLAALQVNLRGGRMPHPEADGHSYLKLPLGRF